MSRSIRNWLKWLFILNLTECNIPWHILFLLQILYCQEEEFYTTYLGCQSITNVNIIVSIYMYQYMLKKNVQNDLFNTKKL